MREPSSTSLNRQRTRQSAPVMFLRAIFLSVGLLPAVLLLACTKGANSDSSENNETPARAEQPSDPEFGPLEPTYRPRQLRDKVFEMDGRVLSAIQIERQKLQLNFDVPARRVSGLSRIEFVQPIASYPFFLFDAEIKSVRIDGRLARFDRIRDPEAGNVLVAIDMKVDANAASVAEIEFDLPSDRATFSAGGVGFLTDMNDIRGRFFERFAPTGFEDDAFELLLSLRTIGATATHQIFSNGVVGQVAATQSPKQVQAWEIVFPKWFTTSSFYVHLTNRDLHVRRFDIAGVARAIPVTIYSANAQLIEQASVRLPQLFQELEADYGPYPHPEFIVNLNESSGGMEYVAATITGLRSLGHELFHSWFARGVMPAEGRSGWIDEAIASWRDYGYQRATSLLSRPPTGLGAGSAFRRATLSSSYVDGRALLAELDLVFAATGGLKPLLRGFAAGYQKALVTSEELRFFLETKGRVDLATYFARYVDGPVKIETQIETQAEVNTFGLHPSALTPAEVERLR